MEKSESKITQILQSISSNRNEATEKLLPAVYDQLRAMAAGKLSGEAHGHTLQPTALVHEAYLKLLGSIEDSWESRSHFFGAAAEAMRRILVDYARTKKRIKRGGNLRRVSLDKNEPLEMEARHPEELIELDTALDRLAELEPEKAKLVTLRFFAGMTMKEAADSLGMSLRTAERNWAFARAWLQDEISQSFSE